MYSVLSIPQPVVTAADLMIKAIAVARAVRTVAFWFAAILIGLAKLSYELGCTLAPCRADIFRILGRTSARVWYEANELYTEAQPVVKWMIAQYQQQLPAVEPVAEETITTTPEEVTMAEDVVATQYTLHDLKGLTKIELREIAEDMGLTGYSQMNAEMLRQFIVGGSDAVARWILNRHYGSVMD
jgi:hypothetical protein